MKPEKYSPSKVSEKEPQKSQPIKGEGMVDSMSETAPNNDKSKIPEAEQMTDENGKLNAEKFKKSYQQKSNDNTNRK